MYRVVTEQVEPTSRHGKNGLIVYSWGLSRYPLSLLSLLQSIRTDESWAQTKGISRFSQQVEAL